MTRTNQTRHISLSPGKEHSVEVSGTKVSTATGPTLWKLEGNPFYIFCTVLFWALFWDYRSSANEES